MTANNLDRDIQDRIESFLGELSALVKKAALDAVHEALGDGAAPRRRGRPPGSVRRGPGRPRKTMRRARRDVARAGKRVRRSAEDLEAIATRVLAQVRSKQGQRLEEIGRALRTDTGILKRPIAKLLEASQLRTEGQKRGTKYFAGGRGGRGRKARATLPRARRKGGRGRKPGRRGGRRATKAATPAAPAAAA